MDAKTKAMLEVAKIVVPHLPEVTAAIRQEIESHVATHGESEQATKVLQLADIADAALEQLNAILKVI